MSLVIVMKSVLLFVMVVLSMVFVMLPACVLRIPRVKNGDSARRKFVLSIFNCFGGGIFVATGFLHLLPEVAEKMNDAFEQLLDKHVDYPFAEFLVCMGFILVLTIENIVMSCVRPTPNKLKETTLPNSPSCRCETNIRSGLPGVTASGIFSYSLAVTRSRKHPVRRTKTAPDLNILSGTLNSKERSVSPTISESDGHRSFERHQSMPGYTVVEEVAEQHETVKFSENAQLLTYSTDKSSSVEVVMERTTLHAFTVALALSVHSVFEGLAFGLEERLNNVFQIFAAIIVHKTILAFSLGINFITVQVPYKTSLLLTVIFCMASPIGGAVGTVLAVSNSHSATITLLNAILLSLATGTFLYIAFVEVIGYELSNIEPQYFSHRMLLVLGIALGYALFAGLTFIPEN